MRVIRFIGFMLIMVLSSCATYQYSVVQSLDEPDSLGFVTYHLIRIKNDDVVLMRLQGDYSENHIIKLKKRDLPKPDDQ